jgi:hypothetical protein
MKVMERGGNSASAGSIQFGGDNVESTITQRLIIFFDFYLFFYFYFFFFFKLRFILI